MKNRTLFLLIIIMVLTGACTKLPDKPNAYVQMELNGNKVFYAITQSYYIDKDTGAFPGKYFYITAFQAFTDSLNNVHISFKDNTTAFNTFCPFTGIYGDNSAPTSGCLSSGKECTGFSMNYFSIAYGQYYTTADTSQPKTQMNILSCDASAQRISATFQGKMTKGSSVIKVTNGAFDNVSFVKQ